MIISVGYSVTVLKMKEIDDRNAFGIKLSDGFGVFLVDFQVYNFKRTPAKSLHLGNLFVR